MLTTERRARKTHKCDACGGEIRPGELYLRRFLPPDAEHDESFTIKEHPGGGACIAPY